MFWKKKETKSTGLRSELWSKEPKNLLRTLLKWLGVTEMTLRNTQSCNFVVNIDIYSQLAYSRVHTNKHTHSPHLQNIFAPFFCLILGDQGLGMIPMTDNGAYDILLKRPLPNLPLTGKFVAVVLWRLVFRFSFFFSFFLFFFLVHSASNKKHEVYEAHSPPMTNVGTETAFRHDHLQAFPKRLTSLEVGGQLIWSNMRRSTCLASRISTQKEPFPWVKIHTGLHLDKVGSVDRQMQILHQGIGWLQW